MGVCNVLKVLKQRNIFFAQENILNPYPSLNGGIDEICKPSSFKTTCLTVDTPPPMTR